MAQVITEDMIFKYLVPSENENVNPLENMRVFFGDVPVNIFKDEYYILYKAFKLGNEYKMTITLDHLEQIVLSNMDDFLKDEKVNIYKNDEESYTENEIASLIQQNVSATFQLLEEYEIEDDYPKKALRFNINLYVREWAKEEYSKGLIAQDNILREGQKYNGRLYKGIEDAHAYFQKKYDLLRSLIEGDVDRLSDVIDTSTDNVQEIEDKLSEDSREIVTDTGVEEFDKDYPLSKSELIVIQGGSGAGKSRQGVNICHNGAVDFGKNVLVLSLEQKSSRIMPMFIAKHSVRLAESPAEWLNDKSMIEGTMDEHQKMIKNITLDDLVTNEEHGRIRVEGVNLHANSVKSYLEKVWDDGFHFDIVMLDYIGILDTGGESRYEALTEVVNQFKAECKTFKGEGFLAILPNQLTNKAEEALAKGDYDMSGTGGSETAYLRRGADYVYTIEQTKEQAQVNKMKWIIEKVRLGEPKSSNLDLIAYQGQCLYMSDDLEEEDEDDELL